MSSAEATAALDRDLDAFRADAARLPLDLVDVRRDGDVVRGRVLTDGQRRRLEEIARAHGAAVEVVVAADPGSGLEEGWVRIERDLVEAWRDPGSIGDDHARQTQYLPTDGPLRVLGRKDSAALVQGPDRSVGWTDPDGLEEIAAADGAAAWAAISRSEVGAAVLPDPGRLRPGGDLLDDLLAEARAHLGVGYLWGGTTAPGFDCSGLVQRVFNAATGVLLPKHSGDQRRHGLRTVGGETRAGDLLFATPRDRKVGHVLLLTSPTTVLHACRSELMVIEESLAENAARYQHQGYRRPVLFD